MIKQEDKQVQSSILSFSSLEQQRLAKPEQATLRPSQEMSELPPLDFSTGSVGSLTRKGAEDCRIQNTLPLFSLWRTTEDVSNTWKNYSSLGLHPYLYSSSFRLQKKQNYAFGVNYDYIFCQQQPVPSASSLGKSEDTRSASPKGLDKIENEGYLLASSAMRENRKNEISVTSMQIKGKLLEEAILPFISPSLLGEQGMNAQYGSLAPQIEVKVSGPEGPGINKLVLMEDLLPRLGETGPCDPLGAATLTGVPSVPEPVLSKNNSYSIDAALLHYDFQSTTFLAPLPGLSLDTSGITKIQEGKSDDLSTATFDLPHSGGNRGGEEQLTSPSEEESFMPCFGLSRDYSFQEESYEDWSALGGRPSDSLVRETQINSLGVLENPKLNSVQSLDSSSLGEQATSLGKGSVSKSWNLQEQLMSDEIQQIYASRLHFQQKIKWFYGLLTTSSLNRHIYPYNSKRGLRSKKLMGLSFLSELERRLDILLYRLSLFPTIASARQAIQHKRIRVWSVLDRAIPAQAKGDTATPRDGEIVERTSRLSALNYAFKEKDIFFPSSSFDPSIPAGQQVNTKGAGLTFNNFYKLPWTIFSSSILSKESQGGGAKIESENSVSAEWMTYRKAFFSLVTPSEEKTLLKHQATIFGAEGEADIFGKQSFDPSLRDEEKKVNTKEEDKRHSINVWSLGKENNFLSVSDFITENSLQSLSISCGKRPSVHSVGQKFVSIESTFDNKMGVIAPHLSSSPYLCWSCPTHLEYHCKFLFALYIKHPSWMNTRLPETADRINNLKNFAISHI